MVAYYESVRPIRDRVLAWAQRRNSAGARAFFGFVTVMAFVAGASVLGLLPYLFVRLTSGQLPSDLPTAISRIALPWLVFAAVSVPLFLVAWRSALRIWPPIPPSTLSPEQMTFVGASAAAAWMNRYADSKRPEYLHDALLELASIFDPKAEPLWRWDNDLLIAKRSVVRRADSGFHVNLTRRQLKSDRDFLRTSWPGIVSDLRMLGRVQRRTPLQTDAEQARLATGLIELGPKVLEALKRGERLEEVHNVLGKFSVLAYALVTNEGQHLVPEPDRLDVVGAASEVVRLSEQLPKPSAVDEPEPSRVRTAATHVRSRLLTPLWDLLLVRLVVRGFVVGVLVTLVVAVVRAYPLPKLDDNTAAFIILGSVTVGAVGWEQLSRRGGSLYSADDET